MLCDIREKDVLMIDTIMSEMGKGNFSFLILVVGIAQLVAMVKRK